MKKQQQLEDVAAYNQRSLNTLSRAIAHSQGEFSLIWVRCNYPHLQAEMVCRLHECCPVPVRTLKLSTSTATLYGTIEEEMARDRPRSLMVLGLDGVVAIHELLTRLNQERPLFLRHFPFPLVLWIDDRLLHKVSRLCPDFKSWGSPSIKFAIAPEDLLHILRQKAEILFTSILDAGAARFQTHAAIELLNENHRRELTCAVKDIERIGQAIEPKLQACLDFVRGWEAYTRDDLQIALQYYQQSLAFWQQAFGEKIKADWDGRKSSFKPFKIQNSKFKIPDLERYGCLLFYLGMCWHRYAVLPCADRKAAWQQARHYFQHCVATFQEANRLDLVAKFINAWGEVLQKLGDGDTLETVASLAISVHQIYPDLIAEAQDRGFLAQVALSRSRWKMAEQEALKALELLEKADAAAIAVSERTCVKWAWCYHRGLYLLLLARSQAALGKTSAAIQTLETAKAKTYPEYDPQLYLQILQQLRSLYFHNGEYLKAFFLKQHQRSIEQQYGFCAFIGSQFLQPQRQPINPIRVQIAQMDNKRRDRSETVIEKFVAMGRQEEIDRAIERICRDDYKLTVIKGPPKIGKSSLVTAGLLPELKGRAIGVNVALPVLVRVNGDWISALAVELNRALTDLGFTRLAVSSIDRSKLEDVQAQIQMLLERLWENNAANLLTVLIFDSVEAFFFEENKPLCELFYEFVGQCINIPFVKIIFCLQEDYISYLLETSCLDYLDFINNRLGQNICYTLGHFSVEDSWRVIHSLTQRAQFHLEPALLDRLVQDLAEPNGEVRALKLQLVGTQLEAEKITTLSGYLEYGLKKKLLTRLITEVIQDCGPDNEETAKFILYSLAEENDKRPIKSSVELLASLENCTPPLELILTILVESGLVLRFPGLGGDRYQLVDREFVPLIRDLCGIEPSVRSQSRPKLR